jgi:hypothetical protein
MTTVKKVLLAMALVLTSLRAHASGQIAEVKQRLINQYKETAATPLIKSSRNGRTMQTKGSTTLVYKNGKVTSVVEEISPNEHRHFAFAKDHMTITVVADKGAGLRTVVQKTYNDDGEAYSTKVNGIPVE